MSPHTPQLDIHTRGNEGAGGLAVGGRCGLGGRVLAQQPDGSADDVDHFRHRAESRVAACEPRGSSSSSLATQSRSVPIILGYNKMYENG